VEPVEPVEPVAYLGLLSEEPVVVVVEPVGIPVQEATVVVAGIITPRHQLVVPEGEEVEEVLVFT